MDLRLRNTPIQLEDVLIRGKSAARTPRYEALHTGYNFARQNKDNRVTQDTLLRNSFESPVLKDSLNQYELALRHLSMQRQENIRQCKQETQYHLARYENIMDASRTSPTLPPVKGLTTSPWPVPPHPRQHSLNSDIYIDTRHKGPSDQCNFKASWRVIREEFPPKSAQGKTSSQAISRDNPTTKNYQLQIPCLERSTTNSIYGSRVKLTETPVQNTGSTDRLSTQAKPISAKLSWSPTLKEKPSYHIAPTHRARRFSPDDDWKTEAWKRANQEYRKYREYTQLSGLPINKRVSNFLFEGRLVLG